MPLVIPLAILLALMVSYGLAVSSRPVSGGFVKWLADKFVNIPVIGGFSVAQVLRLDRYLTQALGKHFQAVSRAGVLWVATLANYVYVVGYWTLYWPVELLHVVHWLVKQEIPRAINARTKPIAKSAANAQAQAKSAASTAHTTTKIVKGTATTKTVTKIQRVAMPHAKEWEWIHNHWHALTHAVTGAIAVDLPIPFGRTVTGIRKRLKRLERALPGTAAFAGAVAFALTRLGLGWVRCNNVKRVGRNLCGLSPRAITDLLGLLADWIILTNICRAFTLLEQGLGLIQPQITGFITAAETWACYGDNEHPPRLTPPALDLPTATGISGLPV